MEKEYIVTLKNRSDLDDFYTDMEASTGSGHIPDHSCDCKLRREISRNTHYHLTEAEVIELRKDSRVLAVEEPEENRGIVPTPLWTYPQSGLWDRSPDSPNDKNWALKRCMDDANTIAWGSESQSLSQQGGTYNTTSSGRNVDVVIFDRHLEFNHPEFAVNPDGSGGSRAIALDWFGSDFASVKSSTGITASSYTYGGLNSHGTHVAGTVAGNTQGWARDANIYNIEFSKSNIATEPSNWATVMWDYVRYWHNYIKPINSATGRKNPTVTNHSWGYSWTTNPFVDNITSVTHQGTTIDLSSESRATKVRILEECQLPSDSDGLAYLSYQQPSRYTPHDADIADAIADGIIVVAAGGNSAWPVTVSSDSTNYSNSIVHSGGTRYTWTGMSPGAADDVICVGAFGAKGTGGKEYRTGFSNHGKRIDIWAPGQNIMSSGKSGPYSDPRNSVYRLYSESGTSMASPQVCGVLACLAEQEPNLTQAEALQHLVEYSKASQISDYTIASETKGFSIDVYTSGSYTYYTVVGACRKESNSSSFNSDLYMYVGDTLQFTVNASGHPFYIKTAASTGTGDQVTTGTITGTQGTTSGTLSWNTTGVSAGTYYYQCGNHASMGGEIQIISPTTASVTNGADQYKDFERLDLSNENNRFLHCPKKRPDSGSMFPHSNHKNRNESTTGVKYPRSNVTFTKAS
tara:strand:- start:2881 stop:4947 length:2067 start_codon:yes stop_codon:yes gene_type:complete